MADAATILNVNDDEASRYMMSRMLKRAGYEVREAATGQEALKLATRGVDLVLLDVNLPDIDGFEVCQQLRGNPETKNTLVLHTSATYVTAQSRIEGLSRGADAYLPQPFEPEELLATIGALLRQRNAVASQHAAGCLWHATFDSIGMGLTFLDREGRIRGCNLAMSAILGRPADAVLGLSFEAVTAEVFGLTELRPLRDIAHVRVRTSSEIPLQGRYYLIAADPLLAPDGSLNGIVLTWSDTTERRRLMSELERRQQALLEADARKDEFLAMLAHELRNPLAAIATAMHLLEHAEASDERRQRFRQTVTRQTRHLSRLVDDLLDVSRVTRGNIKIEHHRVDLRSVVEQAVASADPLVQQRKHELTIAVPDELCTVVGDPIRLEQIVTNLLSNAAKYSEMKGHITVGLRRTISNAQPTVEIYVKDDGIGLSPADVPRVFDLFFQVDKSLSRAQGGLGIGLTVVRRLVELHGGRVRAESAGLGQGADFIVTFPEAPPELARAANGAGSGNLSEDGPLKMLVIEDNADGAEMARDLLESWGHEVVLAMDGLRGLEIAMELRPDAAIVDIGLPGLDGYEIARRLRANPDTADMLLIAMSGYGRGEDRAQALSAGFDLHLTKPVDIERLQRALREGRDARVGRAS